MSHNEGIAIYFLYRSSVLLACWVVGSIADATPCQETLPGVASFREGPVGSRSLKRKGRLMPRTLISILTAYLTAAGSISADAASNKVKVPDQYDGSWTITAVTKDGPCTVQKGRHLRSVWNAAVKCL